MAVIEDDPRAGRMRSIRGKATEMSVSRWLPLSAAVVSMLVVVHQTTAQHVRYIDESIFLKALELMRRGTGYYPAMKSALAINHAPAAQVRSYRPPTGFLILRWLPPSTYRPIGGLVVAVSVTLVWRLVRRREPALQAVVMLGATAWLTAMLPDTYLYAELWALPWFLGAALAMRRDDQRSAAWLTAVAVCFRELYAPALLVGLLVAGRGRRRPWWQALAATSVLGAVHVWLASHQLVAHGNEARFDGVERLSLALRHVVTPTASTPVSIAIAVLTIAGAAGLVLCWHTDRAARFVGPTAVLLAMATIYSGRVYWPLLFGPAVVPFAVELFSRRSRGVAQGTDPCDSPASWPRAPAGPPPRPGLPRRHLLARGRSASRPS